MNEREEQEWRDYLDDMCKEAGVKDLIELCETVEGYYFAAVAGTLERLHVYTSDSTNWDDSCLRERKFSKKTI